MSRALLLRLPVVLALLAGNLALWVPRLATAAIPPVYSCGISSSGWYCTGLACTAMSYACCEDGNDADCDE